MHAILELLDIPLRILHVIACVFLVFVVLLQQGKGGGMGAAFGGAATNQVFGGRGAGNILTRATAVFATIFMLTSLSLAAGSSSQDRALTARLELEKAKKNERGTARPKSSDTPPTPAPSSSSRSRSGRWQSSRRWDSRTCRTTTTRAR
jgi:preprotein translocase subunit SecG